MQSRVRTTAPGAFTLIEVLVVVAIIALLISILLPSLQRAREQTRQVACAAQLHQVLVGLRAYAAESRSYYPYGLAWPASPFGPPVFGALNPRTQFNTPGSGKNYSGYPAYLALFRRGYVPDAQAFYCPAQTVLVRGGKYTWPKAPPTVSQALMIGESSYYNYIIGYTWYADFWMSKDAYDSKAAANFPGWMSDYPDNWWAHGMGRRMGKRQILADRADDPSRTLVLADIMQDYRGYADVLGSDQPVKWSIRPNLSLNSHGGPYEFKGGNVAYNDGSTKWRSRVQCEADFRRSFYANDGFNTWEPQFQHMLVNYGSVSVFPGSGTVYNLYW